MSVPPPSGGWRHVAAALGILSLPFLWGCLSSREYISSEYALERTDSTQAELLFAHVEQTPDSLATLPSPLFFRSPPRKGLPVHQSPTAKVQVELLGGRTNGAAQWGVLVRSVVSDSTAIRASPAVDLFGRRMMMRRTPAWRTIQTNADSLIDTRFVPISRSDLTRLGRADTTQVQVNNTRVRLSTTVRSDAQSLYVQTPDSLAVDTSAVHNVFTVFYRPDTPPKAKRTRRTAVKYPRAALERGISGSVRVSFVVQTDGTTAHVRIEDGAHPLLNAASLRAAHQFTYEPGAYRSRPVPVWMTTPVTYKYR